MQSLATAIRAISALNRAVGLTLSWLSLGVVLVCFTVVVQRYLFHVSFVWMQDLYVWLSGAMFTGVAGFALLRDDHVRVDIFYRPWAPRTKALADLIGVVVFLLPFVLVVAAAATTGCLARAAATPWTAAPATTRSSAARATTRTCSRTAGARTSSSRRAAKARTRSISAR